MKKVLFIAAIIALAVSCSKGKSPKILVLYYSQTSTTEKVAQEICNRLGADIEKIVPVTPYGGNFQETIERSGKEREEGILPELQPLTSDIQSYDIIFLGYPIWFGTYARPMATLLENVDFTGKKVVPFCTFGSGGLDSSISDLKEKLTGAEILPGYGVRAARIDAAPAEIDLFLKQGGFIEGEVEKLEDFSEPRLASEEETAIFDAAVDGYPMLSAKAEKVSSRTVPGGTEYLFEARDIPREMPKDLPADPEGMARTIKVYVLALDGQAPVFTQVIR